MGLKSLYENKQFSPPHLPPQDSTKKFGASVIAFYKGMQFLAESMMIN